MDEAQNIKNQHAQRSLAVFDLKVGRLVVEPLLGLAIACELVIVNLTLLRFTFREAWAMTMSFPSFTLKGIVFSFYIPFS